MKLLPDGHMEARSVEEIAKSPWFWSSKRQAWQFRPEWMGLPPSVQTELCEADKNWQ
jgi:hypothetical protein